MAHQGTMKIIKIQEDKDFLIAHKEKGRRDSVIGADNILSANEQRTRIQYTMTACQFEESYA